MFLIKLHQAYERSKLFFNLYEKKYYFLLLSDTVSNFLKIKDQE